MYDWYLRYGDSVEIVVCLDACRQRVDLVGACPIGLDCGLSVGLDDYAVTTRAHPNSRCLLIDIGGDQLSCGQPHPVVEADPFETCRQGGRQSGAKAEVGMAE